jgi:hypothetical protein
MMFKIVTLVVAGWFCIPLLFLSMVQLFNFFSGKTAGEK